MSGDVDPFEPGRVPASDDFVPRPAGSRLSAAWGTGVADASCEDEPTFAGHCTVARQHTAAGEDRLEASAVAESHVAAGVGGRLDLETSSAVEQPCASACLVRGYGTVHHTEAALSSSVVRRQGWRSWTFSSWRRGSTVAWQTCSFGRTGHPSRQQRQPQGCAPSCRAVFYPSLVLPFLCCIPAAAAAATPGIGF